MKEPSRWTVDQPPDVVVDECGGLAVSSRRCRRGAESPSVSGALLPFPADRSVEEVRLPGGVGGRPMPTKDRWSYDRPLVVSRVAVAVLGAAGPLLDPGAPFLLGDTESTPRKWSSPPLGDTESTSRRSDPRREFGRVPVARGGDGGFAITSYDDSSSVRPARLALLVGRLAMLGSGALAPVPRDCWPLLAVAVGDFASSHVCHVWIRSAAVDLTPSSDVGICC